MYVTLALLLGSCVAASLPEPKVKLLDSGAVEFSMQGRDVASCSCWNSCLCQNSYGL